MTWDDRETIPFPFLNGMIVEQNGKFYKIIGQGIKNQLTYNYAIAPSQSANNKTFTIGNVSSFSTDKVHLKQWVTWIDNVFLEVLWKLNGTTLNQLNGNDSPLTYETSPEHSYTMPIALVASPQPQITYNLTNASPANTILGTLRVILWEYAVEEVTDQNLIGNAKQSNKYTSLDIRGGGTVQGGVS